jgi:outer membrane lipoprotein-sorting protein
MSPAFLVLFGAFASIWPGAGGQATDSEAVQKAIQDAWSRHKSMTARMRMESHRTDEEGATDGLGAGQVEVLRKGEQYVQRTDVHTRMGRTSPEDNVAFEMDITIILDGEAEYVIREGNGQKFYTKMPVNPAISVVPQTVLEFLAKSTELKALSEQTIDGQKVYVIEAVTSEPDPTGVLRTVVYFVQESGALLRKEGYDAANTKLESIEFSDFQFDRDLDPQRFVFEAPPGVTVIDRTRKSSPTTTQATQPGEAASQPTLKPRIIGRMPQPASRPAQTQPAP